MQSIYKSMLAGILCLSLSYASAQNRTANPIEKIGIPLETEGWVQFKAELNLSAVSLFDRYKSEMGLASDDQMILLKTNTDRLGFTRYQFQQSYRDIPVEFAVYNIHSRDGVALKGNGKIARNVIVNTQPQLTAEDAMTLALDCIGAESYHWESPALEAAKQHATDNPNATFYPVPELLIADKDFNPENEKNYHLVWKFDIYSSQPQGRDWVYVDAQSGEILKELSVDFHSSGVPGTAVTRYSGIQEIITDSTDLGFVLRDDTRGGGIETYDAVDSFDVQYATDFVDDDNFWDHANDRADDAATDAHWGMEMVYDYLRDVHGRDSYDNLSSKMIGYVHVGQNWYNARWTGVWALFGDASGEPWTFVEVVGHEFGHGVTASTSALIYARESGALNESYCDLLGESIQNFAFDSVDWLVTPAPVDTLRSFRAPKDYGDPTTYLGENWTTTAGDNYGVHTNSGVQNYWFYLISNGGEGTNDNGDNYAVEAIGIQTAMAIIMRSMETYLTPSSGYFDARQGALFAAEDMFGLCSFEYQQVANAWHAVGVGSRQEAKDFAVIYVDNYPLCGVNDSEFVTMYVKYMGCDSSGPVTLELSILKSNSGAIVKETMEIPEGVGPGEVISYTFSEELNFSKFGDHTLRGRVESESDPYDGNNLSKTITVYKPHPVSDQVFTFYTNVLPRTFRDSIAFITASQIDAEIVEFVGNDSTVGIFINPDAVFSRKPRAIPEGDDLFDHNEEFGSQICFCVDATELDSLGFQFDIRLTFSNILQILVDDEQPPSSAMRIMIDGVENSRYLPTTHNEDEWETHNIDLEAKLGTTFTLCMETRTLLGQFTEFDTIGDYVYLDNIAFLSSRIETATQDISDALPLAIFPNPTQTSAFIEFEAAIAGRSDIILHNVSGQIVQRITSHISEGANIIELNLNNFEAGMYFVEVRTKESLHLGKVVVQK